VAAMRTFAILACLLCASLVQGQWWRPKKKKKTAKNIVQLAVGTKDLSTLVAALKAGKLVTPLEGKGPFTVFAPSNAAFAKLNPKTLSSLLDPKNIKMLDAVLEYHVIKGASVYSKALKPVNHVKTLEGHSLLVEAANGHVTINHNSHVITADVKASNGVVHIIDTVLIPPTLTSKKATKNIVQLAVGTPDLSTLVAALKAGKLVTALEGKGPFTVFAPTNEAFAKVDAQTMKKLLDPRNIKLLDSVLTYHVVAGAAVYSKDLKPSQNVKTLEGQTVLVQATNGHVTINRKAHVVIADVAATNGVVHVIDTVLIPPARDSKSIVELAIGTKDLSTLVTALHAGKLVTALEAPGPFTVFAPSNSAFGKVPKDTLAFLLDPKNIKALQAVLEYHVVAGAAVHSFDIKKATKVKTLQGTELLVEPRWGRVYINRKARVTTANVKASNGIVHIINAVLIPAKINGKPAAEALSPPCSLQGVPLAQQYEYGFEFSALDKDHNGYLNPAEFKSKGVEISKKFKGYSKKKGSWLRGGGKRQLSADASKSSAWASWRKRIASAWKARQEAYQAAAVFNKFDKDHSHKVTLCEYTNAMYKAKKEADMFSGKDGTVVVHG